MRQPRKRHPAIAALLLALVASLLTFTSAGVASAAESMPERHYPAVSLKAKKVEQMTTSPQGEVTIGCDYNSAYVPNQDLVTYGPTGSITRQLDRTAQIAGKANCILRPVVDKNGDLYGKQDGGSTLLAYSGNTLKWQYATGCTTSTPPVVGGNGNIYFVNSSQRLIGLAPELAPGQTTPTKVLDIPVKGTCNQGNRLYAYVDGIVSTWNSGARLQYISYGGKLLGEPPTSVYFLQGETPFDAQGRLFFPTFTGTGVNASITVSVYDPRLGKVAWTSTVSVPGAKKRHPFYLHPTPGGGVIVTSEEQKVVNGTVPNSNDYITAVTELNVNGQKVGAMELPNKDSAGNLVLTSTYAVDMTGKLVVTRYWMVQRTSSPYQVPVTSVGVIDVDAEVVEYAEEMRGNFDSSQGTIYGYYLESLGTKVVIGPNTVYVNTNTCSDNCTTATDFKLHAVKVQGLGMDYPRGEVLNANTSAQPAPKKMAVLGDSYTSGEGIVPFKSGTDTSTNKCHRSELAYASVINRNPNAAPYFAAETDFAACSGAETKHIKTDSFNGEPAQYTRLNASTEIVALTIGGNDIGFSDFGKACVLTYTNCRNGSSAYNTALGNINNVLPNNLATTYQKILDNAPNAQVYVLGYPQVAPAKSDTDPEDLRCTYLYNSGYDSTGTIPQTWADAQAAREIVTLLNNTIEDRVDAKNSSRLHYVDVNEAGSPFEGHTVCANPGDSYFNNLDQWIGHEAYALHPNEKGAKAYEDILAAAVN
ncbi:hypothetical protein QF026_004813 [Streptomyces aurantiacus]|uniref:SGNH/GDSL hydrolase family protein n=1 Tax=Streptomyces aurantiacus TaxID=47760 RepID=UPI0027906948|nr:SGNH/GDSL hydrolase family protein [Streptomyces aurantiacus]MDQ0776347.1 hypothetical protein [Streptomyces aurantiacus]